MTEPLKQRDLDAEARLQLQRALSERFGETVAIPEDLGALQTLEQLASRRVHRSYSERPVSEELIRLLCACALSAPSKSDLQQRDIVVITDRALQATIAQLLPHMPWVGEAPAFLIFCANGRRVRQVAALRGKPFPNNHLDLFFNAVGDAAIALATCLHAAEAVGLGCCPISEIRNHLATIDRLLGLPEQVIPFAGLCIGWPRAQDQISPRLPLGLTVHENRYTEPDLADELQRYDHRREALQPYEKQYQPERWGMRDEYGWSEQKARQYAVAQRVDFGAYVRAKGFVLE
jgi:nitroreductase/FMN reductase [NAD(P)H]